MMKNTIVLLLGALFLVIFVASSNATKVALSQKQKEVLKAQPDGMNCAVCSALVLEAERLIDMGHDAIKSGMKKACKIFPGKVGKACEAVAAAFGDKVIDFVNGKLDADVICHKLGMCDKCHVVQPKSNLEAYYNGEFKAKAEHQQVQHMVRQLAAVYLNQFKLLKKNFRRPPSPDQNLDPNRLYDWDGDSFATVRGVPRGAYWKGKDCNDLDKHTHPGIYEHNKILDKNCNGIHGKTKLITGDSYEDTYCNAYEHDRQIFFFGDSASAGFSINAEWLELKNLTQLLKGVVNEFSWPEKAFTSGNDHETDESLLKEFIGHNRCAKEQFQNVAFSGAMMVDLPNQIKYLHSRQDEKIKPALVFIGYVGNDVCEDSLEEMTSAAAFRASLEEGLRMLDEKLPANSRVVVFSLVDGEILFDHMHDKIHPISTKNAQLTYEQFYDFLSCTGLNPCRTWLTTNETMRKATSAHARELDNVIHDVIEKNQYTHFKAASFSFTQLIDEGFKVLEKRGRNPEDLINKVDGFHPSLDVGHPIIARVMWDHLKNDWGEDFLGPANPNNEAMLKRFGH